MGIRDRAIEAQDQELGRTPAKTNYLGAPKTGSQSELFGTPHYDSPEYDYDYGRPYSARSSSNGYENIKPGTFKIELLVPISELGEAGDPDSPKFDYNRMYNDAEIVAMEKIEEFAGADVLDRYEVAFQTEESVDDIEVTATLTPISKK